MLLQKIESELFRLSDELEAENKRHEKTVEDYKMKIKEFKRQKAIFLKGIDIEKIKTAETVLAVRGLKDEYDKGCTCRAIRGIAVNDGAIKKQYYGVKNYVCYIHQTCDCDYGMGPICGEIVFSIGLQNPDHELTEEETECCLYYLNIILDKKGREAIAGEGERGYGKFEEVEEGSEQ